MCRTQRSHHFVCMITHMIALQWLCNDGFAITVIYCLLLKQLLAWINCLFTGRGSYGDWLKVYIYFRNECMTCLHIWLLFVSLLEPAVPSESTISNLYQNIGRWIFHVLKLIMMCTILKCADLAQNEGWLLRVMLMNMKEFVFSNWLQNIQMHLSKKPNATSKQKKKKRHNFAVCNDETEYHLLK